MVDFGIDSSTKDKKAENPKSLCFHMGKKAVIIRITIHIGKLAISISFTNALLNANVKLT